MGRVKLPTPNFSKRGAFLAILYSSLISGSRKAGESSGGVPLLPSTTNEGPF